MSDDFVEGCCLGCMCGKCLSDSDSNSDSNLECCYLSLCLGIFLVLPIALIGIYGPMYDKMNPTIYCKIQAPITDIIFYNKIDAKVTIYNQTFDVKICTFSINDNACVTHDGVVKLLNNILEERKTSRTNLIVGIILISLFTIFVIGFICHELFKRELYIHNNTSI